MPNIFQDLTNKNIITAGRACGIGYHYAMLVKDGRILAQAQNVYRSHARTEASENSWRAATLHAEQAVIYMARGQAKGATLYVVRRGRSGLLLSEPCDRCVRTIKRYKIRKVVHS
jgi:deoxycytidylate deaminase